ncbi:hypothetical protein GCM10009078_31220 [Cupriavidus gilardii]
MRVGTKNNADMRVKGGARAGRRPPCYILTPRSVPLKGPQFKQLVSLPVASPILNNGRIHVVRRAGCCRRWPTGCCGMWSRPSP